MEEQPKTPDKFRAQRRRERWRAFFTPWIYLGSIVGSVAMLMALIKNCSDRFPPSP